MTDLAFAEELCEARVAEVLRGLGRLPATGHPDGVDPRAAGVFEAAVRFAIRSGLLRCDRRPTARLLAGAGVAERLLTDADRWASDPIAFAWLARALDGLPDVLRGDRLAEAVLFPGGDTTLVERLYRDTRALRIYEGTSEVQKLVLGKHVLKTLGPASE